MTERDLTILRADAFDWQPWANGGGVSATLLEAPGRVGGDGDGDRDGDRDGARVDGDGADWRIALAVIDRDGPFSDYSRFTRTLLHAGGPPLTLVVDGEPHVLRSGSQLTFDGAEAVRAVDVTRPVHALNLFVRTGRASGGIAVGSSPNLLPGAGSGDTLALLLPASAALPPAPAPTLPAPARAATPARATPAPAPAAIAPASAPVPPPQTLDALLLAGQAVHLRPDAVVAVVRVQQL